MDFGRGCVVNLASNTLASILSSSSNHLLLTEFLGVNLQTNETGSELSFAQKLATLHSALMAVPEGHSQAMFGFPHHHLCWTDKA